MASQDRNSSALFQFGPTSMRETQVTSVYDLVVTSQPLLETCTVCHCTARLFPVPTTRSPTVHADV
jgi:hypothetical protein